MRDTTGRGSAKAEDGRRSRDTYPDSYITEYAYVYENREGGRGSNLKRRPEAGRAVAGARGAS